MVAPVTTDSDLLKPVSEAFERTHFRRVLAEHEGDKKAVAAALGVHLATLYRHLQRPVREDFNA